MTGIGIQEVIYMENPLVTIEMEKGDSIKSALSRYRPEYCRNFISLIQAGFTIALSSIHHSHL